MGCSPFKSCYTNPSDPVAVAPNPSPTRWVLLRDVTFPHATVLKVKYLDCTNFEGIKVMVYEGRFRPSYELDPHFFEYDANSPIARFRPDKKGWSLALGLAKHISYTKEKVNE